MQKAGVLGFKVGQRAEMRTFEDGFRSAWFNGKILDMKKNQILLEYFDFENEEPSWVKIYQKPPYRKKSKLTKNLLMVRPPYPAKYHKDNMPPVSSLSDTCVVINGPWKVGNLVDWSYDDCYWTATIIKVLSDNEVQIELPKYPVGERKNEEEGKHVALCKDLRPSLDWSETKGWTFPAGQRPCDAQLVFPTKQGTNVEVEHAVAEGDRDTYTDTYTYTDTDRDSEKNEDVKVEHAVAVVNASSTTGIPAEGDRDKDIQQNENVKLDCGFVESSESVSSLRLEKRKSPEPAAAEDEDVGKRKAPPPAAAAAVKKRELNIMREHTLEAGMLDLEGLVNKIKWMQRLLQSPATTTSSWKFA